MRMVDTHTIHPCTHGTWCLIIDPISRKYKLRSMEVYPSHIAIDTLVRYMCHPIHCLLNELCTCILYIVYVLIDHFFYLGKA